MTGIDRLIWGRPTAEISPKTLLSETTRDNWRRYSNALRAWKEDSARQPHYLIVHLRFFVGITYGIYVLFWVAPRSEMPAPLVAALWAYVAFVSVVYAISMVGRHPFWHLASMAHWLVFMTFITLCSAYSLLIIHSPSREGFWSIWLFVLYLDGAIVFGATRAVTLLAIPMLLHTLIIALYYWSGAPFNPGNASDDMLISGIAAQAVVLSLVYVLTSFRKYYASAYARAEALIVETRQAAERGKIESELASARMELDRVSHKLSMSALAASLAHEINQPLSSVVANADAGLRWLSNDEPNVAEARSALAEISLAGHRVASVIASVRSLLRRHDGDHAEINIGDCVTQVVHVLRMEAEENDVTVLTQIEEYLPPIWCNRVQLQQLLINLIKNALEAMANIVERKRLLLIRVGLLSDGRISIAIEDNGKGVPQAAQRNLFAAFYTTKPEGMGMGLVICKSIVDAHGGELIFKALPNGTEFQIVLPQRGRV